VKQRPWKRVHFTAIGGVAMSGLAHILLDWGIEVSGTDAKPSEKVDALRARGARASVGHDAATVVGAGLLVYSSAVPGDNPELVRARELGIRCCRRGEFLAEVAALFDTVVAVGGSHGKTTTAAMLTHVLKRTGRDPGFMVGGDVVGWPRAAAAGNGRIFVTEVDESDRTQALLRSSLAIVANVEDDHCWNVGGVEELERCFVAFANSADTLLTWDAPKTRELFAGHPALRFVAAADRPPQLVLQVPGEYYRTNATLAIAAAAELGVPVTQAAEALADFDGVARRLTEHFHSPDGRLTLAEDYAHHPTELRAAVQALREAHPGHRLVLVFQPHRFERVKRYAAGFARALSAADRVVVVEPFAAWRDNAEIADARDIVTELQGTPSAYHDGPLADLAEELAAEAAATGPGLTLAVVGAGDVCRLVPLLQGRLADGLLDELCADLAARVPGLEVGRQRTWAQLTTLGIGTARPLVARPETSAQLRDLLRHGEDLGLPTMVLGAGSNIVGTDEDAVRLVIRLHTGEFARFDVGDELVAAGAGVGLGPLLKELAESGRLPARAAPLAWIPGTVGGAVAMNAGAHGVSIGEFVEVLEGVTASGAPWDKAGSEVAWQYRATDLPAEAIVTRVTFRFPPGDREQALRRLREAAAERRARQPSGRSAGCVFRNPESDSAGRLLDASACKGTQAGACRVSQKHANFFLAAKSATESDFLELMLRAQRQVHRKTGIALLPEVKFAGPASAARIVRQMGWLG